MNYYLLTAQTAAAHVSGRERQRRCRPAAGGTVGTRAQPRARAAGVDRGRGAGRGNATETPLDPGTYQVTLECRREDADQTGDRSRSDSLKPTVRTN